MWTRKLIAKLKAVPYFLGQQEQYRDLVLQTNECIQRLIRMRGGEYVNVQTAV